MNLKEFERLDVEGWKGKDEIEIRPCVKGYVVVEHRKNKKTGEIKEETTVVPKENVEYLILLLNCFEEKVLNYGVIAEKIIESRELPITLDGFNGGRNRAKYYFPFYYYPLKVLEAKKLVDYGGSGKITKLF